MGRRRQYNGVDVQTEYKLLKVEFVLVCLLLVLGEDRNSFSTGKDTLFCDERGMLNALDRDFGLGFDYFGFDAGFNHGKSLARSESQYRGQPHAAILHFLSK
jgi:hypothetical protein